MVKPLQAQNEVAVNTWTKVCVKGDAASCKCREWQVESQANASPFFLFVIQVTTALQVILYNFVLPSLLKIKGTDAGCSMLEDGDTVG